MRTFLETIVLGLLLVVLLSCRWRLRAPLGIRYILLTMWYPEPTLSCTSYSTTRHPTFTWMTCVSLPPAAAARLHLRRVARARRRCLTVSSMATILPRTGDSSGMSLRAHAGRRNRARSPVLGPLFIMTPTT